MDENAVWYVAGEWISPQQATISVNDVGLLRGYSAFEALRTYNHRPFHLHEHIERLYQSAAMIDLEIPFERQFLAALISECIERNTSYIHAAIRILLTGGISVDGIHPGGQPTLVIMITPLGERDMERFARGVKLATTHLARENAAAKTSNYVAAIRALKAAEKHGASDALYVNAQGHVLECTRSNFFVFRDDTLITPREGVLAGITRQVVLELAQGRFQVEERPILQSELAQIDEAFISSSSKEITPVVQIDDLVVGTGKPGPRTYTLEQRFIEMIERGDF